MEKIAGDMKITENTIVTKVLSENASFRIGCLVDQKYGVHTNLVFSLETFNPDNIAYTRDFGPTTGMWEDHAVATSSASLGSVLYRHGLAQHDM